jgi:hypothetical protein
LKQKNNTKATKKNRCINADPLFLFPSGPFPIIFHINKIKLTTGRVRMAKIPKPAVQGPLGLKQYRILITII